MSHDCLTRWRDVKYVDMSGRYLFHFSGSIPARKIGVFLVASVLPDCFDGSTFNMRENCLLSHLLRFHFKMSDILSETGVSLILSETGVSLN